jgi:hypothetical protein
MVNQMSKYVKVELLDDDKLDIEWAGIKASDLIWIGALLQNKGCQEIHQANQTSTKNKT